MDHIPTSHDSTRKRPRSTTSSDSSATYKRGVSEDAMASSASSPPLFSTLNKDIDAYMLDQDGQDLPLHATESFQQQGTTSTNLSTQQQFEEIDSLRRRALSSGDTWYIVSQAWYKRWEDACSGRLSKDPVLSQRTIPPVDNTGIIDPDGDLRLDPPVTEGDSVEFIPEEAWRLFVKWYGQPSHTFSRKVVPNLSGSRVIETYPPMLRIFFISTGPPKPTQKLTVSMNTTFSELVKLIPYEAQAQIWQIDLDRVWSDESLLPQETFETSPSRRLLLPSSPTPEKLGSTLMSVMVGRRENLVVDFVSPKRIEPPTAQPPLFGPKNDYFLRLENSRSSASGSNVSGPKKSSPRSAFAKLPAPSTRVKGTVGLNNLGNTCFMNSALQCLAHLPELTEYFLSGLYTLELNPDNPLSTGGVLAKSYAELLRALFAPNSSASSFVPRDFKHRISMHAPAFSGYAQHDSQELLAFLLDGLHEDLNRVLKKPYVEKPDWEGGDREALVKLATDTWEGYMKRNDSVIVDLFQGQYKSTLVCPECGKVSITFDPFMYLTLPLPVHKTWTHEIMYVPYDISEPHYTVKIEVPYNSSLKIAKQIVSKRFNIDAGNLLCGDFFRHKFYRFYPDHDPVSDIIDTDHTVVYGMPESVSQTLGPKPDFSMPFIIPVYHLLPEQQSRSPFYRGSIDSRLFGVPFMVVFKNENGTAPSKDDIYDTILGLYGRWTRQAAHLQKWGCTEPGPMVAPQESTLPTPERSSTPEDGSNETSERQPNGVADAASRCSKQELFKMHLRESNEGSHGLKHQILEIARGRTVDWSSRAQVDSLDPSVLRTRLRFSDAIVCEWDPQALLHFFGEEGKGKESLWDKFPLYTDPEMQSEGALRAAEQRKVKRDINLEDCLDEFTKEEQLGEDDLWYCPKCKKHQQATKRFELWKVPDILVVHLKRFSSSRSLRDKIDVLIDFPIEGLNLESRVGERSIIAELVREGQDLKGTGLKPDSKEPLVYDLFAVDEHIGGLGGGHYRAYAKNTEDQQWYHFDDSHVQKAKPEDSVNSNAYLLFYRRRTSSALGGEMLEKIEAARLAGASGLSTPPPEIPNEEPSSRSLEPFIGPVHPNFVNNKNPEFDDDLPSFEESSLDVIAIPRSDAYNLRRAPSPTSSMDADLDADSDHGSTPDPLADADIRSGYVSLMPRWLPSQEERRSGTPEAVLPEPDDMSSDPAVDIDVDQTSSPEEEDDEEALARLL